MRGGIAVCAIAVGLAASGCGGSDTTVVNRTVSPAQEQEDLKRALDAGAITASEYQQQIRKLQSGR